MVLILVFLFSLLMVGYVYGGYPMVLRGLVRLRGPRPVRRADVTPTLSLVISAYNESGVIRSKLENALSLQYPAHARDIVVISDASDDGTDEIVATFASRGVHLARQPHRRGKTAGLNHTVPTLRGEIVVFSDANAMYDADALLKLARNFADPEVGCVTGEARYLTTGRKPADVGERMYWNYEMEIKRLETALGSMVGGDGAIYAIRRSLWRELPENAINDFLNPLQIVASGWRAIYEPEAVCYEETTGGMRLEYKRRVRIVSRSWRALFQAEGVLNPGRVGLFAWALASHKMLRWFSGVFVALAVAAALGVLRQASNANLFLVLGIMALGVTVAGVTAAGRHLAGMGVYFVVVNAASIVGVMRGTLGQVSGVWTTPRQHEHVAPARVVPVGLILRFVGILAIAGMFAIYGWASPNTLAKVVFWVSCTMLGYVYVGYPAILAVLRRFGSVPVRREPIAPHVCVFITANDEAGVIRSKLQNTLDLDYPADRLTVVVASDGSVDGTNEIVRTFAPRVQLLAFSPRRGKIAAINEGMASITTDVVVFSDANTFLQKDSLLALVQNFADPRVGGVSGDVVLFGPRASYGQSEDLYYQYERWVQNAESEIGSMIGADGALYAIRRNLFVPPPDDTILDDMAIPMSVVKAGRRVVYEKGARAFEEGSKTATEEFTRKARVIAGAMQFIRRPGSAVPISAPQAIFSLVSHKALRWLSPAFGTGAFLSSLALADAATGYAAAVMGQAGPLGLGVAGCIPSMRRLPPIAIAHYFCLLQAAAALGFVRGMAGRQSVLWRRFERAREQSPLGNAK